MNIKYYTGEGIRKEFEGYKIESMMPILDNGIYVSENYNYYTNTISVRKIHTYTGLELLQDLEAIARTTYSQEIDQNKIYRLHNIKGIGWTAEGMRAYSIDLEEIIL